MDNTIKRLQAYQSAGAPVLYSPGINSLDQVEQIAAEVIAPINVLAPLIPGATVDELTTAVAKRSEGNYRS